MKEKSIKKRLSVSAIILLALILPMMILVSYAWLSLTNTKLGSLMGVEKPAPFLITGPYGINGADIRIDFLNVNASNENQEDGANRAQYLFRIKGDKAVRQYDIVIAHTTNVNYTYSLYKASKTQNAAYSEEYSAQLLEIPFYYSDEELTFTGYNRADPPNDNLAVVDTTDSYYQITYKDANGDPLPTEYVQKNAMPIYEYIRVNFTEEAYNGEQYYIFNTAWSAEDDNLLESNQKETDMVYIFVKTVESEE